MAIQSHPHQPHLVDPNADGDSDSSDWERGPCDQIAMTWREARDNFHGQLQIVWAATEGILKMLIKSDAMQWMSKQTAIKRLMAWNQWNDKSINQSIYHVLQNAIRVIFTMADTFLKIFTNSSVIVYSSSFISQVHWVCAIWKMAEMADFFGAVMFQFKVCMHPMCQLMCTN